MRKYLLPFLITIFVSPLAFGDAPDLKSAEQVAKNYLQLNFSGDYNGAASLIDPESIDKNRSYILELRQNAQKYGQTEFVKQMDISDTDEELEKLSLQDFYVKAYMKMQVHGLQQDQHGQQVLAGLKSSANSVSIVDSKILQKGIAEVHLQFVDPITHQSNSAYPILRLDDSQWKVILGQSLKHNAGNIYMSF